MLNNFISHTKSLYRALRDISGLQVIQKRTESDVTENLKGKCAALYMMIMNTRLASSVQYVCFTFYRNKGIVMKIVR